MNEIATKTAASQRQLDLVRQACALLESELETGERLTLAALAERLNVSPWHLQRVFRRITGVSPRDYADAHRDQRFRTELRQGESVASATYGAGFGSASRVYEDADRRLGMTPASYAKGGAGARIVYGVVESPLGQLLVAATAKGVCFVSLGEDVGELEAALRAEFPRAAEFQRDDEAIEPALTVLLDYIEGKTPHVDLPLDVRATAFQRRVWQGLLAIPPGETRTYQQIARELGVPKGQRAIGGACAHNPVALIVPCHRAMRSDGGLGGYRWGVERKKALLRREAEGA